MHGFLVEFSLFEILTVCDYLYAVGVLMHLHLNVIVHNMNEPRHEISNNVVCSTSKGSDQPAHRRSLIRAFASHLNILTVKLLTENYLEFLSFGGDCTCSFEIFMPKIPHCLVTCRGSYLKYKKFTSHRIAN